MFWNIRGPHEGSKGKTAFCFPGQLHERPMLKDHPLREDPHFKELLRKASNQTKFDLLNFSFGGEGEEDDSSLKLQMSTYFLSMVHFYRLRAAGWNPDIFAEHSMGIYSALAASEAISFEEGLFITEAIGQSPEERRGHSPGRHGQHHRPALGRNTKDLSRPQRVSTLHCQL